MMRYGKQVLMAGVVALVLGSAARAQQSCESLANLKLPHVTITSARLLGEGPASGFRGAGTPQPLLPAHCEVKGTSAPTADSEIRFEVWLPATGWNGKLEQVGNGGWAGAIPIGGLAGAIRRGYAAAGTDDGHSNIGVGGGATWAMGHPEKLIDFGYRAVHETVVAGKAIVLAYYGKPESRAYFMGCSDGGREALMEAQRYPDDFIGIIAGAPANYWTRLQAGGIWDARALSDTPESYIPSAKLPAIQKAALAACDALDGVTDGVIENPRRCHFDPSVLLCKGPDGPDCLTAPQVEALKKIYGGPVNPRTGKSIFPGFSPGVENVVGGWAVWIIGRGPGQSIGYNFGDSYFADTVFGDPKWDYRTLNFDTDIAKADSMNGGILNSMNPDLRAFHARGGKLIQYHGWGDPAIPALSSVNYYEMVKAFFAHTAGMRGKRTLDDFYRLFMVPGMSHCGGGNGANSFGNVGGAAAGDPDHDVLLALDRWVEKGIAPEKIIATRYASPGGAAVMTRPLCPYPKVAKYKGSGSTDDAANFDCVLEKVK